MTIAQLKYQWHALNNLRDIARWLHHLDEAACNGDLTPRQQTRLQTLEDRARRLAQNIGYNTYRQTDPRGAALYLIPADWLADYAASHYPDGIALDS